MDNGLESLGKLTFLRSYSKNGEDYNGTVTRYLNFMRDNYPEQSKNIKKYGHALYDKLAVGSQRLMQFAGEVAHKCNSRAYNCSFIAPTTWKDFADITYLLMQGCGVGISVEEHYIKQLPAPTVSPLHFVIDDTKEAWADSFLALMSNVAVTFDYSKIRPLGAPLSSGGTASGHGVLEDAHKAVKTILTKAIAGNRKLHSDEVADIVCHIATSVISGGSRRSAVIILTSVYDTRMANYKSGDWWNTNIQRAKANISSICQRGTAEVLAGIVEQLDSPYGERGLVLVNEINENENTGINPCQPAFATVLTRKGIKTFADIEEGSEIWDGNKFVKVVKKWSTGIKEVFRYVAANSSEFVGTTNHRICVGVEGTIEEGFTFIKKEAGEADGLLCMDSNEESGFKLRAITSIESLGEHEVFDITVDSDEHVYWTGGCIVSNCSEISLRNRSFCNLSSIIVPNCQSKEDFLFACEAAAYFGTLQAGLTSFKYISPEWTKNAKDEALIGVSMTGLAQAGKWMNDEVLKNGSATVVSTNDKTAKTIGINQAMRTTTLKPEGSTSCVMSCTSGIHAALFEYGVRRIRITKASPLAKKLIELYGISESAEHTDQWGSKYNLPTDKYSFIVHEAFNDKDIVLQFPCHYENAIYTKDESAVGLLQRSSSVYKNWIVPGHREGQETNNVSITVTFREEEKEELKNWLLNNTDKYRAVSTLPLNCTAYPLLPFEETSYDEYKLYLARFPLIDWEALGIVSNAQGTVACSGGGCEINSL